MRQLSNREKKEIIRNAHDNYGLQLDRKQRFEERDKVVIVDSVPHLFYYHNKLVPTLKLLQEKELLKKVVVDMGAVRFVVSGADIMRPGIVKINEDIKMNEFIAVVEEQHSKELAVGVALYSGSEIMQMEKGKVISNIHYIGDKIWNLFSTY